MGLFEFVKNAGAKLFGGGDAKAATPRRSSSRSRGTA